MDYKRILVKISGETLTNSYGIDSERTHMLAQQIAGIVATGVQLGIVIGGGNIWRGRSAGSNMDRSTADSIGMLATVMNGLALGDALKQLHIDNKVVSSFAIDKVCEPFFLPAVDRYLNEGCVVIFTGGTGSPYFSTDTAASLRACEIHADALICLKAVDGVYDSDPVVNKNAKKYDEISFDKVIADNLKALDITAIAMCREYGVKVIALSKDEPDGIVRVLGGEKLGTIIK